MLIIGAAVKYFKLTFTKLDSDKKDIGIAFNSLLTLLFIFPTISIIISYIERTPLSFATIMITII